MLHCSKKQRQCSVGVKNDYKTRGDYTIQVVKGDYTSLQVFELRRWTFNLIIIGKSTMRKWLIFLKIAEIEQQPICFVCVSRFYTKVYPHSSYMLFYPQDQHVFTFCAIYAYLTCKTSTLFEPAFLKCRAAKDCTLDLYCGGYFKNYVRNSTCFICV